MIFLSRYKTTTGQIFGDYIYAKDWDEATKFVELRGMREVIVGILDESSGTAELPSELITEWRWSEAAHAACWLVNLAIHSKIYKPKKQLADNSLVHMLLHLHLEALDYNTPEDFILEHSWEIEQVYAVTRDLEKKTPGVLPLKADREKFGIRRPHIIAPHLSPLAAQECPITLSEMKKLLEAGDLDDYRLLIQKQRNPNLIHGTCTAKLTDKKLLKKLMRGQ